MQAQTKNTQVTRYAVEVLYPFSDWQVHNMHVSRRDAEQNAAQMVKHSTLGTHRVRVTAS